MDNFIFGIIVGLILGSILFIAVDSKVDHTQAIAHHAAHYDSVTGVFTWNQPE
jgi:hypothetical protein